MMIRTGTIFFFVVAVFLSMGTTGMSATNEMASPTAKAFYQVRLSAPVLLSPADGSTNQPLTFTLGWIPVVGATTYQVEIARTSAFSGSVIRPNATSFPRYSIPQGTLQHNTLYFWRVRALGPSGSSDWSEIWTFRTVVAPPIVSTEPASNVHTASATLRALVNPNNSETRVYFEWGTNDTYGNPTSVQILPAGEQQRSVSADLSGLQEGTTYHYRIVAENDGGTSHGENRTFTTLRPPSATTEAAQNISPTSATLRGTVNPHGTSTQVIFEYGEDENVVETISASPSPIAGSSNTSVTASLTGLKPATTYHYRVAASSVAGDTDGQIRTFETSVPRPDAPDLLEPANNAERLPLRPTFSWNAVQYAKTYRLQIATNNSFGNLVVNQGGLTSTSFVPPEGALDHSTQYHWRVRGEGDGGHGVWSDVRRFTTVINAPSVTTEPATEISTTTATLVASVNPNGGETTAYFEWGTGTGYGNQTTTRTIAASNNVRTVTAELTGLAVGTTFHFRVVATNEGGTSRGNDRTFTTLIPPPDAPALSSPPNNATGVSTTPTLTWNVAPTAERYTLQIAVGSDFQSIVHQVSSLTSTSFPVPEGVLVNNETYLWRVRGINAGGSGDWSNSFSFTTEMRAPAAETGSASDVTASSVILHGTVNPFNAETDVRFEYGTSAQLGSSVEAAQSPVSGSEVSDVSAEIQGLNDDTEYFYRLVATSAGGTSQGETLSFLTSAIPPDRPELVSPDDGSIDVPLNVELQWADTPRAAEYRVQVASDRGFQDRSIVMDERSVTTSAFEVSELERNATYYWRVRSSNRAGQSAWTDPWSFSTVPLAPRATTRSADAITQTSATLTGIVDAAGRETRAFFEWGLDESYGNQSEETIIQASGSEEVLVSTTITLPEPGRTYHFRLVAENAGGRTSGENASFVAVPPTPELTSPSAGETEVAPNPLLTWRRSEGTSAYHLQLSASALLDTMLIDEPALQDTAFAPPPGLLQKDGEYYWRVRALNPSGASPWSEAGHFTTYSSTVVLTVNRSFGPPNQSASFRMVGLPGDIDLPVNEALPGSWTQDWIAFDDPGDDEEALLEFDRARPFRFRPGKAFWILTRREWTYSNEVPSVPLENDATFAVPLNGGWNLISSPFHVSVGWESVQATNDITEELWAFDGAYEEAPSLEPYEGYYFFNSDDRSELIIPYPGANHTPTDTAPEAATVESVSISLYDRSDRLSSVRIGTSEHVANGGLARSKIAPPSHFEPVSIRLVGLNQDVNTSTYWIEQIEPTSEEGYRFELSIRTADPQPVMLKIDNPDGFENHEMVLIDKATARRFLLSEDNIWLDIADSDQRYVLLVGSATFINEQLSEILPKEFVLWPAYPNPFRGETRIAYSLPEDAPVTLTVFDILGRRVTTLQSGVRKAGYHELAWPGLDESGRPVSSGVYICLVETPDQRQTQKMVVVR